MTTPRWTIQFDSKGALVGLCLDNHIIGRCQELRVWNTTTDLITRLHAKVFYSQTNDWQIDEQNGEITALHYMNTLLPRVERAAVRASAHLPVLEMDIVGPFKIDIVLSVTAVPLPDPPALASQKKTKCECGAAATGFQSSGPQHSSYCPMSES